MSGSGKRNTDTLNTIGIVVVGICGAVLVYVTITALQAFYANDTSDIQTMADYGGQDMPVKNLRAQQMGAINEYGPNPAPAPAKPGETAKPQTFHMSIADAKKLVIDPKADPGNLLPVLGPSNRPTVLPIYGRPKPLPQAPAPATGSGSGSGSGSSAEPGAGSGSDAGSASAPGAGSAAGSAAPKGNGP